MQLLLDPANLWLGRPGRLLLAGDRKPVAVDDQFSVLRNAPAVSIDVLGNDVDREGPVTLISAYAALGSAVAEPDGTVTYTPIPDFTGFDTVVYEMADSLDQRDTGQVDIHVRLPELDIETTPQSTFIVTAEAESIDITVTEPAEFAASYSVDLGDLGAGPVNLAAPSLQG